MKYRVKETWKRYNSVFVRYYVIQRRFLVFWFRVSKLFETEMEAEKNLKYV